MSDLSESYEIEAIDSKKKYYPTVTLPIRINPEMVGKTIDLKIKAKVVGISETEKNYSTTVELRSCLNKTKKQGSSLYIQPWMDEK